MALSKEQIVSLIKEPKAKAQLIKALKHEQRVRFHAEESTDENECSPYLIDFWAWVARFLPADKFTMFKNIMGFPIYTNELIKGIAEEYAKVYESQNSSFTYEFSSETIESEFKAFLRDIDFWSNWKDESAEAMLTAINSILIVDLPAEALEEARPYYYFQSIDAVEDLAINALGGIEYILVKESEESYFFIDDFRYARYQKTSQDNFLEVLSSPHGLGYCPATFFWKESIKKKKPLIKRSPITPALTNLNWLLFFETARRCLETYAAYPIITSFKDKCTYFEQREDQQIYCNAGFIDRGLGPVPCPACASNKIIGPGTWFKVPMPSSKEQANNIDAVKVIPAERNSLDYCTERSAEIWDEIFYDCVGYGGDDMQSQAVNEKQVRAGFESKQNILIGLKENLEASHKFVVDTMARIRYGSAFKNSTINYGTDFYLKSSSEAVSEYKEAKTAGVPNYFINHKRNQIDSISTKGNETDQERLFILKHLEPWLDMSLSEAKGLQLDLSNREMFMLKSDFSRLILKFESEYGSIVEFGSLIDFKIKIDRINQQLLKYVKEDYPKPKEPAAGKPII